MTRKTIPYGHCPQCTVHGEMYGDCYVHDGRYFELWICAREDEESNGYEIGYGCGAQWWETFQHVGQIVKSSGTAALTPEAMA